MEMCGRHLVESVNGKRQLVFPFLDCVSYKLFRIGPILSVHLVIFNFFFFQRMFICFLMKMIYINNKHCEKSADAVCYRITWKNNDERHQALMRHLELHIKRQPGVFLHSLGNWCLSLMPCASLTGWMLWFGSQMTRFIFFFSFQADILPIKSSMTTTENSSGSIRPDRDASLWTETSSWNTLAMRFIPPKYWETHSEIGFCTAGCIDGGTNNCLKHVIESGCQLLESVLVIYGNSNGQQATGLELLKRLCCNLAKIKYQFKGQLSLIFNRTLSKMCLTGA